MIYIILQTYSKKIDTSGIEIIIILFVLLVWFLITGGEKSKSNKSYKNQTKSNKLNKLNTDYTPKEIETKIQNRNSLNYPKIISDKLSDTVYMNTLIDNSYNISSFNLRKYHKEFSTSQFYNGTLQDLDSIKISNKIFGSLTLPEFWFITYKNLVYLFNGEILVPCSGIMKREEDCIFNILYIPDKYDLKISNRLYFDLMFYDEVVKHLDTETSIFEFLNKLSYYISGFSDEFDISGYNTRFIFKNKIQFESKITILDKLNSLEFLPRLYFTKVGLIQTNIEKLINSFYNYNTKDLRDIVKITKSSTSILSQDEILQVLKDKFKSNEELLNFFNYHLIEDYFLINKTKGNYQVYFSMLSYFFYSNYLLELQNKHKTNNIEKFITQSLNEFKNKYYRSITPNLREIESEIRVSKGYNIVGSFTNESILFNKIKETYKDFKVISQGSPSWLGRQRIDIYFPDLNIGIEYHGDQHFKPIPFFGGEEGLIQRQLLDKRKEKLCLDNNCKLICVDKDYLFEELKNIIDFEIQKRI